MAAKKPPRKKADEKAIANQEPSPATPDITPEEAERRKKETMDRILERAPAPAAAEGLDDPIERLAEGELSPDKVGPHRRARLKPILEKLFLGFKAQLRNVALSKPEEFHGYAEGLKLSIEATIESAELVVWKYLDLAGPYAEESVLGASAVTSYLGTRHLERRLAAAEKEDANAPRHDPGRAGERKDDAPQPPHPQT